MDENNNEPTVSMQKVQTMFQKPNAIDRDDPIFKRLRNLHPDLVDCETLDIDDFERSYRWHFADGTVLIQRVMQSEMLDIWLYARSRVKSLDEEQVADSGYDRSRLLEAYREKDTVDFFNHYLTTHRSK